MGLLPTAYAFFFFRSKNLVFIVRFKESQEPIKHFHNKFQAQKLVLDDECAKDINYFKVMVNPPKGGWLAKSGERPVVNLGTVKYGIFERMRYIISKVFNIYIKVP